jgi:4-amino-4-deoxy-L-arabinose transferase-like glycosyltransferase
MINKSLVKTVFWIVLLLLTLILGRSLRTPGYNVIPDPYIILDEHTHVWNGLSLRSTGIPAAWSILSTYTTDSKAFGAGGRVDGFNIAVNDAKPSFTNFHSFPKPAIAVAEFDFGRGLSQTQLVQPSLEHPPFGAFILSLGVSKNAKTFADVNNYDLRQSAITLAIVTQILIFVLAFLITKKPLVGIIASTVYATVPSYVLLSRYALLENVVSPLVLSGIILFILARNRLVSKKADKLFRILVLLAGIVGGLTALTKLTGWIFILGSIILLYLWKFKFKQILIYAVPAFFIGILYFAWGFYLSPKLFADILLLQGSREFIGSINLLVTFFRVSIYNFPLDGWWIGGFIALLVIPRKKEYLPITVPVVAGLFSALALVGANYPWYFIPLIPFMAIAIAVFLYDLAIKPTFVSILLTFFVFVSSSFYWGYGVFQKIQPFMLYRVMFLLFVAMGAFWALTQKSDKFKKVWYVGVVAMLVVLAILNRRSMFFILENWGKLPLIYTPGTF